MTYLDENLHRAGTMGRHAVRKTSVVCDGILSALVPFATTSVAVSRLLRWLKV